MPYAVAADKTRLYYEEAGQGAPILFLHEFAGDYASWEPQIRYFSRGYRCIVYSARGYAPSDIPASDDSYSHRHFRDDALAVLDHLGIERAHLVGLSMGAYSAFQVGLHDPDRAISLTLAGVGTGSVPDEAETFRKNSEANAARFEREGSEAMAQVYARAANRIPFAIKDPRGFQEFVEALGRHDAFGSARTQRGFQGARPSLYDFRNEMQRLALPVLVGDEDDACLAPSLVLKRHIPASGLAVFPKSGHVINLEEPALFNATLERFLTLAQAGRWPPRASVTQPQA
jgi:3-oxoadipate enol-lactonase